MKTSTVLLTALLSAAFAPALAEDAGPGSPEVRIEKHVMMTRGEGGAELAGRGAFGGMQFGGELMQMHGKPVKNAPYSAEVVSERQQNLADGNQIATKTSTMSYRDSAGRTRQEVRDSKGEVRTITIHDAADGSTYILRPQDKSATKIGIDRDMARAAGDAARSRIEQMRKEGKLPRAERSADGEHEAVIVKRIERMDGTMHKQIEEDVRITVDTAMERVKGMRDGQIGAVLAGAFGDMKWASKATTRDLGTRDFDGVKAEGKLRSYEIPAGEVGNRNPIAVSDESWFAPDLQVTVYSKHSDPRTGDNIYRLSGVKRGEPPAALFTVPSDYAVKDVMANIKKTIIEKK